METDAVPDTRYASSPGGYIAYQVFGHGPPTTLLVTDWLQNLDVMWDEPTLARYLRRLASFSRSCASTSGDRACRTPCR